MPKIIHVQLQNEGEAVLRGVGNLRRVASDCMTKIITLWEKSVAVNSCRVKIPQLSRTFPMVWLAFILLSVG